MCDFSLQSVRSRPAKVGDKLVSRDFGTGTRGFADVGDRDPRVPYRLDGKFRQLVHVVN